MPNKISPHDKFFKVTMSKPEVAKDFLAKYLPLDIKAKVNLNTLSLQKESFIDQRMKGLFVDLFYSVEFDKSPGYIYVLFEHLSNFDKTIAFRIWKYMINIMDHHLIKTGTSELPTIWPIILYTGKGNYIHSVNFFDLFGSRKELAKNIFLNPFRLINIYDIPESELSEQFLFGLMVKAFKSKFVDELRLVKSLLPNLKMVEQKDGWDYIVTMVHYILEINDFDPNKIFDELSLVLTDETRTKIMTAAERLRQEGMERGIQQGMQQGKYEGKEEGKQEALRQVAINLLNMGKSPDEVANATGLSLEKIGQLSKRKH
jgi:predicted transposase/invertase (TIGR01784 family)